MTAPMRILANATVAKLEGADRNALNLVSDLLSYYVEGAEFMTGFGGAGSWNGRSSFLSRIKGTFPAGFTHAVYGALTKAGHKVQLVRKPLPSPLGPENPIVDEFGNDDPRYDFQLHALHAVERHGRGIIQVATGGGKSKIAKLIVARFRRPTLFLTTRGVLMHQMADSFRAASYNVGLIGDGNWSPVRGVNCGMVQTLISRLEEPDLNREIRQVISQNSAKGIEMERDEIVQLAQERFTEKQRVRNITIKFLQLVEVVIGEEAHEAGGGQYYTILEQCRNAHIRVALTATPYMRDGAEDNMRLQAAFGPILIKVSEKTLIQRGILARPFFLYAGYTPHPKLRKSSPWQRARQLGIVEADDRNAKILQYAARAVKHRLPVMVLIQLKSHGEALMRLLKANGMKAVFLKGEDDQVARREALDKLRDGKIDVLIGTTILDVGVDVPAVGMVILAGGGKAEVALRQRVGRGLRAKKSGANVCFIVDFKDDVNLHLRDHYRQRRSIIEATPGFAENILADGADFDWSLFEAA